MNFAVIGAGAWGTAFALHLARMNRPVVLLPRRAEQAAALSAARENTDYLPGVALPDSLRITADPDAAAGAAVAFFACPLQSMRETAERLGRAWGPAGGPALASMNADRPAIRC